jgi:hypothetical protein
MRNIPPEISFDKAFTDIQQYNNSNGWNCMGLKRRAIEKHIRALLVQAEEEICQTGSMGERIVHEEFLKDLDAKYEGVNLVKHVRSIRKVPPCKSWVGWDITNCMSDVFFHSMLEHMTGPNNEKYYPIPEQYLNVSQRYKWILHKLIRDRKYIVDDIVEDYRHKWLTTPRELLFPVDSEFMGIDDEDHMRIKPMKAFPSAKHSLMFGRCPPGTVCPADLMLHNHREKYSNGIPENLEMSTLETLETLDSEEEHFSFA